MNESGLQPVDYKVLVRQHEVETATDSGIITSVGGQTEREQWAETKGTVIAVGGFAFMEKGVPWEPAPQIGDTVLMRQYAGYKYMGSDGIEYQLCNDKDIMAICI